jgi:regulator of RNase E activity RraB
MGIFTFLRPKSISKQFVNVHDFNQNKDMQMKMTTQVIDQLRKLDIKREKELSLEYFFYTNTIEKAERLASEIVKLNYKVDYWLSAGDPKLFIVTGWTTKMKMDNEIVEKWTKEMCELGNKYDCDFDGWGTDPNQAL